MSQNQELPINSEINPSVTTCAHCQAPMPLGLRFCRNCGYRLGEGSAEYTETARFEDGRPTATPDPGAAPQSYTTTYGLGGLATAGAGPVASKRKKKISGMAWMFIGLLVFFLAAAAFTAVVSPIRQGRTPGGISIPTAPRAYFGVSPFEDAENGVTFDSVDPPGGPADKADLVGGDVITSFDGKAVADEDAMVDLLRQSAIGKTVDVIYIRDGETKTTKVTPVSKDEFDRLVRQFRDRPERKGRFGFDDDRTERVPIEGTKMFGVRLDDIQTNYPADMAGIKEGDVVIEFGGTPIRTPEELSSRVRRAIPYSTVDVVVMRGTERVVIPVKMGSQ